MQKLTSRALFYLGGFSAAFMMLFTTGCASGGFKLTRQYAQFVNRQDVVIRVVLFLLTFVVFGVTMLVDLVINNTMDFWEGRVSQGDYQFKSEGKTFQVRHEIKDGLKHSTIKIQSAEGQPLQEVVLNETSQGQVELYVDGKLRSRVDNIKDLPVAAIYDAKGVLIENRVILMDHSIAAR